MLIETLVTALVVLVLLAGLAGMVSSSLHPVRKFVPAALIFYGAWLGGIAVMAFAIIVIFTGGVEGITIGLTPALIGAVIVFLPLFAARKIVTRPPRKLPPGPVGPGETVGIEGIDDVFLFLNPAVARMAKDIKAKIETEFGDLTLEATSGDWNSAEDLFEQTIRAPSGTVVTRWKKSDLVAELLIVQLTDSLPADEALLDACAIVWRMVAIDKTCDGEFKIKWASLDNDLMSTGGDGDDGPQARSWSDGEKTVTIGTSAPEDSVTYSDDSIHVRFSQLRPGTCIQVHFVVATTSEGAANTIGRMVVDQKGEQIIEAADLSR